MELLFLLWLHFIGDYPLQGEFLAKMKGENLYLMFCHVAIWTGTISVGLFLTDNLTLWKIIFLFVIHFMADSYKVNKKDKTKALTNDLYKDQLIHFIQILIVYLF